MFIYLFIYSLIDLFRGFGILIQNSIYKNWCPSAHVISSASLSISFLKERKKEKKKEKKKERKKEKKKEKARQKENKRERRTKEKKEKNKNKTVHIN